MNKEIWKEYKQTTYHHKERVYEVSNKGNVRMNGEERPTCKDDNGYIRTTGNLVHRLVAEAFIPNPENKPTVNHKNGIKHDNNVDNLEWATYKEQEEHKYATGLAERPIGDKNIMNRPEVKSKMRNTQVFEGTTRGAKNGMSGIIRLGKDAPNFGNECSIDTKEKIRRGVQRNTTLKKEVIPKLKKFTKNVIKIEQHKNEDVYDITTKKHHNFFANSVLVHNCAEKPLLPYGSCLLGSINLSNLVIDKKVDMLLLKKVCRIAVRQMNIVLDEGLDRLPLPENKTASEKYRNLGIGITGLADMFIKLNIEYGSQESLETLETILATMANTCIDESADEALRHGPAPFLKDRHQFIDMAKSEFLQKVCTKETLLKVEGQGLRNCEILSIAPTGSLSMIMNNCSSGIEPHFSLEYNRVTKAIDGKDKSYKVSVPIVKWYEENYKEEERKKEVLVTALTLDHNKKIAIQSVCQKYIDSSISSTCNVAEETTPEEMSNLYIEAWKAGLKGLTVFRNNCKKVGILTTGSEKAPCLPRSTRRPELLDCDIHYSNIKNEKWIMFVGMYEDIPYEMIGGRLSDNIIIPKKHKTGYIRKNGKIAGRQTYDLILGSLDNEEDQLIIKDIAAVFSPDVSHSTRLISMLLRHNVGIHYIIDQLKKMNPDAGIFDFEKVVQRILSKYLREQKTDMTCPDCNGDLIRTGGCVQCANNCGWSRCD